MATSIDTSTRSPLLTRAQVAEQLGVSRRTVQRYTEDGVLPCVRLPSGQPRYRQQDIDACLVVEGGA